MILCFLFFTCSFVSMFFFLFICLFLYICSFVRLFVFLYVCLFALLSVCLFVCLFVNSKLPINLQLAFLRTAKVRIGILGACACKRYGQT